MRLYRGLRKAEATALFLMRSEVIGLKDWLTRVGVPNVIRRCDCPNSATRAPPVPTP